MIEEILMHEVPVGLVVLTGQAQVFVHIEGNHVGEGKLPRAVHPGQLPVHPDGAGAGGQTQDEGAILFRSGIMGFDLSGDIVGGPEAHFLIVFLNDHAHG